MNFDKHILIIFFFVAFLGTFYICNDLFEISFIEEALNFKIPLTLRFAIYVIYVYLFFSVYTGYFIVEGIKGFIEYWHERRIIIYVFALIVSIAMLIEVIICS